jgi:hypothetical protein
LEEKEEQLEPNIKAINDICTSSDEERPEEE